MYTLLREKEYAVDRDVWLRNEETGTIDMCYDNSWFFDEVGFAFMEIGKSYECKIELTGRAETEPLTGAVPYQILSWSEQVGTKKRVKVCHNGDIYYIAPGDISDFKSKNEVWFTVFHKDLIQVDETLDGYYTMDT